MPITFSGTECIHGNGGNERRVNAAAQTYQDFREAAFANVVARTQHQSVIDFRIFSFHDCRQRCRRRFRIDDNEIFFERSRPRHDGAVIRNRKTAAIKYQAVVAAHLVHHQHHCVVPLGNGRQHLLPQFALPFKVGRSGDVDDQRPTCLRQLFNGVALVQPIRPEVLIVPGVLANRNGEFDRRRISKASGFQPMRNSAARRTHRRKAKAFWTG